MIYSDLSFFMERDVFLCAQNKPPSTWRRLLGGRVGAPTQYSGEEAGFSLIGFDIVVAVAVYAVPLFTVVVPDVEGEESGIVIAFKTAKAK